MANVAAICSTFKQQLLLGNHAFGTCETRDRTTADAFKAALYFATGSLGAGSTVYTTDGEVTTGDGYTTAGADVTAGAPGLTTTTAHWTPGASLVWTSFTHAAFDGLLIYNDSFATKRAVAVFNFGEQTVTAGTFSLTMPTADASTGLIRLGD